MSSAPSTWATHTSVAEPNQLVAFLSTSNCVLKAKLVRLNWQNQERCWTGTERVTLIYRYLCSLPSLSAGLRLTGRVIEARDPKNKAVPSGGYTTRPIAITFASLRFFHYLSRELRRKKCHLGCRCRWAGTHTTASASPPIARLVFSFQSPRDTHIIIESLRNRRRPNQEKRRKKRLDLVAVALCAATHFNCNGLSVRRARAMRLISWIIKTKHHRRNETHNSGGWTEQVEVGFMIMIGPPRVWWWLNTTELMPMLMLMFEAI